MVSTADLQDSGNVGDHFVVVMFHDTAPGNSAVIIIIIIIIITIPVCLSLVCFRALICASFSPQIKLRGGGGGGGVEQKTIVSTAQVLQSK